MKLRAWRKSNGWEERDRILGAIEAAGQIVVPLDANVFLVSVPAKVTTIKTVNESGFNPHEVRETVTMARCVILGFGTHLQPDIKWKAIGATYWRVTDDADAIEALAEVGIDLRAHLE